jgi:hypothetical protein
VVNSAIRTISARTAGSDNSLRGPAMRDGRSRQDLSRARRGRDVTNGFLHDSRAQISGGWLLYELGVSIVLAVAGQEATG